MPMLFLLNSQLSSGIGDIASSLPVCKEPEAILDYSFVFSYEYSPHTQMGALISSQSTNVMFN